MSEEEVPNFKVVFLSESGVGKTRIISRYINIIFKLIIRIKAGEIRLKKI